MDSVSLFVAVGALQIPAGSIVVEVAFVALWQASRVLLYQSSNNGCYCGMNRHNLLLFGSFLLLFVILELPLVVSGFGGFEDG